MSELAYRDVLYPLNVFMHILTHDEGEVRYLHYGLFDKPGQSIAEAQERSTELLLSTLAQPPLSILDVGVGLGTTLDRLVRLGYGAEGISPDEKQVAMARARYPHLRIHQSKFETFTPDRRYDCVVFQESSQYIDGEALFRKASELTDDVTVIDEFSNEPDTLHHYGQFLASATRHGFQRLSEVNLSARTAPTIDYFL